LSGEDAYTLCSIAADLRITQLVDVHKGVHVMLPKTALVSNAPRYFGS
jgi:acetamidase/formamidase